MLDIGWTEMLVIAIVLIIVVGPKDLPGMLRTVGRTVSQLRSVAGDFRKQFDEALKEAELDEVRKSVDDVRKLNPTKSLRDAMNPLRQAGEDLRNDLQKTTRSPTVAKKDPSAPKAGEDAAGSSDGGDAAVGAAKPASKAETATGASSKSVASPPAEPVAGTAGRLGKDAPRTSATKPAAARTASKKPAAAATTKTPAAKKAAPRKTGATRKTAAKTAPANKPATSAKTTATKKSDKTGAEGA